MMNEGPATGNLLLIEAVRQARQLQRSHWRNMPLPLYFTGTDPVPDTIDIPCEVVEDKQLPENTETPKP